MKISNVVLTSLAALCTAGILASNYELKSMYDQVDKTDPYWNFEKVLDKPFRHLHVTGGNVSNISYEQTNSTAVKILRTWRGSHDGSITYRVNNDTLYINFSNHLNDNAEKLWMNNIVPVRILAPTLISITGVDTRLTVEKFTRNFLDIHLTGRSRLLVNSYKHELERVNVYQNDSSLTILSMSRDVVGPRDIHLLNLNARLKGTSILDMKACKIDHMKLSVDSSAGILLTGATLSSW